MQTCLLPLTVPESLLCRTLAQILGQQLDTYTLPSNIHTASRTCFSGLRQKKKKKEKRSRKRTLPPPHQTSNLEKPSRRASGKGTIHFPWRSNSPGVPSQWKLNQNIHHTAGRDLWNLAVSHWILERHICFVFWERNPVTTRCSCKAEGKEATLGIFPLFLSPFSSFVAGMNWWSKQTRWHPWVKWHHLWPLRLCPQAPLLVCL